MSPKMYVFIYVFIVLQKLPNGQQRACQQKQICIQNVEKSRFTNKTSQFMRQQYDN